MKPSYFNYIIENYPDKKESLIYNTRTQALAVFESTMASLLRDNKGQKISLDEKEYNELLEEGFCIADNADELEIIDKWFDEVVYNKNILTSTILVTYRCNFACPYCFEKKSEKPCMDMTEKMADNVCNWILRKAIEKNSPEIHIFFYGGEPLMNKKAIDHIIQRINTYCIYQNTKFKFGIVTNGYLITKEDTERWKPLGLDFYRITLDGSESWHNQTRPLKGGFPTFQRIIENIRDHTDGVKVLISGNYTETSYPGILELIEHLSNHEIKKKIHSMTFAPVMDMEGKSCPSTREACLKQDEKDLLISSQVKKYLTEYGFRDSRSKMGMQMCPLKLKDSDITITPDGEIYKCPVTVGNKDFCAGHVNSLDLNERNEEIILQKPWKKCFPCVYLPLCAGGCYIRAYLRYGNLFALDCPKGLFDATFSASVMEEYEKLSAYSVAH